MYLKIKNDCKLIEKRKLTDFTYYLKYSFITNFEWKPGQYVGITTGPTYRRSYSIVDYDGENLGFLIDVRPGGPASIYFDKVEVGATNQILGPYGKFMLQNTSNKKVFISTGTGIAPFIPMIKMLRDSSYETRIEIYSGARFQREDIAFQFIEPYINENVEYHQCISRETPKAAFSPHVNLSEDQGKKELNGFQAHYGRVTDIIPQKNRDWKNTEFYICGSPQMVDDTEKLLKNLGADKVFVEKY